MIAFLPLALVLVVVCALHSGALVPREALERAADEVQRWRDIEREQRRQIAELQRALEHPEEEAVRGVTLDQLGHEEPPRKKTSGPKAFSFIEGEPSPHIHLPEPVTLLLTDELVGYVCRECLEECDGPQPVLP